jgi:hypothetical protein
MPLSQNRNQKNTKKKVEKKDYLVEAHILVPATVRFKVNAESPEQAADLISKSNQIEQAKISKFDLSKVKKIVARVFIWNSWVVKYIKKF